MTPDPFDVRTSRRTFLVGAAGLAVAAACGSDDDGVITTPRSGDGDGRDTTPQTNQADAPVQPVVASVDLAARDDPQRFTFGVLRKVENNQYEAVEGPAASVSFRGPGGRRVRAQPAVFRNTALPGDAPHGAYTTEVVLDATGVWYAEVHVADESGSAPFEVAADYAVPSVGSDAPRAASPTADEPLGADPVCTREPPCALHAVSLDDVVGSGKPVVVLFATPARCTSRFCGPIIEAFLDIAEPVADRAHFVHVEIFKDLESNDVVPTVSAWELPTDPWLFAIDGSGEIVARIDAAFDPEEMQSLVDAVTA
jgi:hypothetical protein